MKVTSTNVGLSRVNAVQAAPFNKSSIDIDHIGLDAGTRVTLLLKASFMKQTDNHPMKAFKKTMIGPRYKRNHGRIMSEGPHHWATGTLPGASCAYSNTSTLMDGSQQWSKVDWCSPSYLVIIKFSINIIIWVSNQNISPCCLASTHGCKNRLVTFVELDQTPPRCYTLTPTYPLNSNIYIFFLPKWSHETNQTISNRSRCW